jgi:sulfonate transport system permease protein
MSDAAATAPTQVIERAPGLAERHPQRHARRRRTVDLSLAIGVPILLILLWQLAADRAWIDPHLWPSPANIVREARELWNRHLFLSNIWDTVRRLFIGFGIGGGAGLLAGYAMGLWAPIRSAFESTLGTLYTVPKLALLPILITMFGLGDRPIIALVAVTVFFFVWIATLAAVLAVSAGHREAALAFGVNRLQLFRHVLLPASLPQVVVGLRISMGVAVLSMIGAELFIGQDGIGFLIQQGQNLLLLSQAFVGIVLAGLLGFVTTEAIRLLSRALLPWSVEDNTRAGR